jgi:predicted PurR-regulated permease PerM
MNGGLKRLAVATAIVLATLAGAAALWHFRGVAGLFLLSLAMAATLRPLVERQMWMRRRWAVVVTHLAGLCLLLLPAAVAANLVLGELQMAADSFVLAYDQARMEWPSGTPVQQALAGWLPAPSALYEALAGEQGRTMAAGLLGVTVGLFDGLLNLAIVVALSVYWSLDQARFERLWLSALPTAQRVRAREIWRTMEGGVGAYLRSELAQSLLAAVLLGAGYWLLGLRYPALLAALGALAWLVPWLGAILAIAPAVLVGALAAGGSGWLALAAGLYSLAVLLVLEFVVEPRLVRRGRHSSLLVVLLALGLGQLWGLAGVLAAPPLAAALQILFSQLVPQVAAANAGQLAAQVADLEQRLAAVRAELAAAGEPAPPETRSLVDRLGRLLAEAPVPSAAPSGGPSTSTR